MPSPFRGAGRIEMRSVDTLTPYDRNARKHSAGQLDKIAASIQAFGFNAPILVDAQGLVIAGHGRLEAAKRVGLTEVPVVTLAHLTDVERRAYTLTDNRVAEDATWDEDLLAGEMAALAELDIDLALTGFSIPEVDAMLARLDGGENEGAADAVPDTPAHPVSQPGDLWLLGRHRVICGDSTAAEVVKRLLGEVEPHLMVTDPPYGVEYDADWRNKATRDGGKAIGGRATGKVLNDDKADWSEAWALFPGDVAYVWHAGLFAGTVAESLQNTGFKLRSQIIWAKSNFAIGRGDYHWHHEPCWYAVREGKTGHYGGDRKQTTLWQIPKPQKSETGHSTQKPVECMARPIRNNSSPGQVVYDPFLGSGTTMIAAETERRIAFGCELNPAYVDVIVKRWQDLTGGQATLEGDGRSFADIAAARGLPDAA